MAFVDGDVAAGTGDLVVTDLEGQSLAVSELEGVRLVDYDERNDVVVALTYAGQLDDPSSVRADTMVLLSSDSLDEIHRWPLAAAVSAIDARDGWLLLTGSGGSVEAVPIDNLVATETLVDVGATAATWLR